MPRPTREQIDDEIVESAAAPFARHGFRETSVQRIADAVGYSKTGLLHRFPTKEALQDAVLARWAEKVWAINAGVTHLPPGAGRDHAVVTAMVDLALRHPGIVALLVSGLARDDTTIGARLPVTSDPLFEAFAADRDADLERSIRIGAALASLAVVSLAVGDAPTEQVRAHLVAASYDALGHGPAVSSED